MEHNGIYDVSVCHADGDVLTEIRYAWIVTSSPPICLGQAGPEPRLP